MKTKTHTTCLTILTTLILTSTLQAEALGKEGMNLTANTVIRGYTGAESDLYELDVPSAAIVSLDVMTPAIEENPVKLNLFAGSDTAILHRSATRLVLDVATPGILGLSVTTRSPGRYKLVTNLTEVPVSRDPFTKTEPETVDPEPEPDGLLAEPATANDTCGLEGRSDDHGDTPSCATQLTVGSRVAGEVDNAWGDDVDVFILTLGDVTTVEWTLAGDVTATFEDFAGNRLAITEDTPKTWTATLSPGNYLVRVEGVGAAATYELRATPRPW